jgi:hypothetical protein
MEGSLSIIKFNNGESGKAVEFTDIYNNKLRYYITKNQNEIFGITDSNGNLRSFKFAALSSKNRVALESSITESLIREFPELYFERIETITDNKSLMGFRIYYRVLEKESITDIYL